jgi:hypothetical protein
MSSLRIFLVLIAGLLAIISFAACGGGGQDEDDGDTEFTGFIGIWSGDITITVTGVDGSAEPVTEVKTATLTLEEDLSGSLVISSGSEEDTHSIDASLSDDELSFDLSVSDSDEGECDSWDVSCEATLSSSTTVDLSCSGFFCENTLGTVSGSFGLD